jgi:signal peptidase S26 family
MTRRRLGVAVVSGRSMEPTLHEGDRLLVLWGARPRVGRMAVVRLPPSDDGPRPVSVKRVTGTDPGDPGAWWVERDNPGEGVDSWLVGGISDADVLGRVLVRLPRFTRRVRRA